MVSREQCVAAINDFIEKKELKKAVTLFEYLCELKNETHTEEIQMVCSNPTLLSMLLPNILEELQKEFNINKITDRNNTLITVY